MSKWFRFYSDAVRNPKVAALSDREFRLWVSLLSVASDNAGRLPCLNELKHVLNARLDHLSTGVERLIRAGLIDALDVGYEPHNWAKFQYKSDTSTERVKKHRAERNVSETPPEADTEQRQKEQTPAQQPITPLVLRAEGLLDKLLDAAGVRGNPPPGLAMLQPILGLMDAGYDLERDILPAIKAKPKPDVRQWSYFVPQIRDAAEARKSAASIPKPAEAQFDWGKAISLWADDGYWSPGWGPKPGEPGCRAPTSLLEERAA
jgi:hypothetical protein